MPPPTPPAKSWMNQLGNTFKSASSAISTGTKSATAAASPYVQGAHTRLRHSTLGATRAMESKAPSKLSVAKRRADAMLGLNHTSLLEVDFDRGVMMAFKINPDGKKSIMAEGKSFEELLADYNNQEPKCTTSGTGLGLQYIYEKDASGEFVYALGKPGNKKKETIPLRKVRSSTNNTVACMGGSRKNRKTRRSTTSKRRY
jgi:hypothetical protein